MRAANTSTASRADGPRQKQQSLRSPARHRPKQPHHRKARTSRTARCQNDLRIVSPLGQAGSPPRAGRHRHPCRESRRLHPRRGSSFPTGGAKGWGGPMKSRVNSTATSVARPLRDAPSLLPRRAHAVSPSRAFATSAEPKSGNDSQNSGS